jgi:hypothetical protein
MNDFELLHCKATLSGFFDHMAAKQSQKAFSLVTTRYSSALSSW